MSQQPGRYRGPPRGIVQPRREELRGQGPSESRHIGGMQPSARDQIVSAHTDHQDECADIGRHPELPEWTCNGFAPVT